MINYNLELNKLLNKIYDKKLCEILLKEEIHTLKNLTLENTKKLIKSREVYLGNDLKDYISDLIPQEADEYFLRVDISKTHNITYPILYNENKDVVKSHTHNNFATILWYNHTTDLLIDDIYNKFNQNDFSQYIENNLDSIYQELINYVITLKEDNRIIICLDKEKGLVNTVKEMLLDGKLDYSYALSFVDMDKLREDMFSKSIALDFYDEFDRLEDDLEECLNNFFKYSDEELLEVLVKKQNFKLINNIELIKQ